jgi:hypothetical protein
MKRYFTIITLALITFNVHAELNKWVDADGKVHYSDTPPPEVQTQNVRSYAGKGQSDAPASYSPKSVAEREAEMRKSKQTKEEASKKKAEEDARADAKKRNCEGARQNARSLSEGGRIYTYDEKGERAYMDDAARAQRLEEANKVISENCN